MHAVLGEFNVHVEHENTAAGAAPARHQMRVWERSACELLGERPSVTCLQIARRARRRCVGGEV